MSVSLEAVLNEMFAKSASDLYLTTGLPPTLRVHGRLVALEAMGRMSPEECQRVVYSFLTDEQKEQFEREWELDLCFGVGEIARIRANVLRQRGAVAAVLRNIPTKVPGFAELGLPKAADAIVNLPKGLIIVSGATGSGKSTTLASMLNFINESEPLHIITVEDPIEYLHPHKKSLVNQREVGQDTNSFSSALKYALREDPDVVLIGEMRDLETIESALVIAETGHLVFATLHTPDAIQAINRVIDVFPAHQQAQVRSQLAFVLQAVICQQLVPAADNLTQALIAEVLLLTPAIRNLIREEKVHMIYSMMQTGQGSGMCTMNQSLQAAIKERRITRETAYAYSADVAELEKLVRGV
jgi:twitching motility protein PilT